MMHDRDEKIYQKLREYEVDVPEFSMKKSTIDRWGNWLFGEAHIPVPRFTMTKKGMNLLYCLPFPLIIIAILPILF